MILLLFLVCLIASTVGAIAGFGGGVIIKPVLDALGILPVSTISFLSGCTVLAMSVSSLLRSRGNGVKLDLRISTPLAIGAVCGGLGGTVLLRLVKDAFQSERTLGGIQAVCLTVLNVLVFLYICYKDKLPAKKTEHPLAAALIGLALGLLSSFIGIGGGPINVAALFLFFSMDARQSAKNSIYIIMFSQAASLVTSIATGSVPDFQWPALLLMMLGGVGGALLGAAFSSRMDNKKVETLLRVLMVVVTLIAAWNVVKFFLL